jgi:DNA-binding NtrC family response regulator
MKESILIVDDDKNNCNSIAKALSGDYTTHIASNGHEALNILNENRNIHIVLSDVMMPGMNGLELLERINFRDNNTIVIMITGFSDIESAIEAKRNGAYDYIIKPVDLNRLEVSIKNALEINP